ncbi:MAG: succinyl-diaminopimelate desuccinylase [Labilithrix sp.]|nr:succinyl-diaminopimelate desuccinylase [Labilithrix sp.]MCW5812420.1 succinyl-diaminopimelate desuccinylase [Labilithrix sp.]
MTREVESLDATLLWLCAIPSPIGEEKELCDAVAERLARQELAGPIRRYNDSIVVPVLRKKQAGRPHVALVGHLDTVRTENGPARAEGGRIYGAGAADMKAGLAVMIVLAETASVTELVACDLTLVFYAREEGPYLENELGPVLEKDDDLKTVDLAICLEPSDNKLHLGCCGAIHATVTFQGRTAHSARPWEGDNAVVKAAGLLDRLAKLEPIAHEIDGHVYKTVTTVTLANGGRGKNIVPDTFVLNLNHRFAPSTSSEQAQADLRALIGEGPKVEITDVSPAALPNASHPLVQKLVAAGVRGVEPKQAWTDVGRFAALGVPAVNFGPGENAQAHQKNESTDTKLVFEGYRILLGWLLGMSG